MRPMLGAPRPQRSVLKRLVNAPSELDVIENAAPPRFQYESHIAVLLHNTEIVYGEDHGAILTILEDCLLAFFLKSDVADEQNFVDQKAFEIDGDRQRERKAHAHTTRIVAHLHVQLLAELRKVLDELIRLPERCVVDFRDEPDVVVARQFSLEPPPKCQWP